MLDDKTFFAWLDGELGAEEAASVALQVAADPALMELATKHRRLTGRLRDAFASIAESGVPARIEAAVQPPHSNVFKIGAREPMRRPSPALPQWAAMAASLVVGLSLGLLVKEPGSGPIQHGDGAIYASTSLEEALDEKLASAPRGTGTAIGLSFRARDGAICRSFSDAASSGLACRDGNRWRLRGLFGAPEGQGSDYRMATGMDPALASLIDTTIAGDAFDAAQERAAKERGWR